MPVSLSDTEWTTFQQRWAESHRGVRNAHTVAMLEFGAKWIDANVTQRDMEFPELRRASREEIREAFAIHGQVLGISENVNRANAEAGEYGWAKRHMVPRAERIKDALNGPFLRLFKGSAKGYEFAYSNPIPEDRAADDAERLSKAQSFATLVTAGVNDEDAAQASGLPKMRFEKPAPPPAPIAPGAGAGGEPGNARR
jgi:phage portal protein BeeE